MSGNDTPPLDGVVVMSDSDIDKLVDSARPQGSNVTINQMVRDFIIARKIGMQSSGTTDEVTSEDKDKKHEKHKKGKKKKHKSEKKEKKDQSSKHRHHRKHKRKSKETDVDNKSSVMLQVGSSSDTPESSHNGNSGQHATGSSTVDTQPSISAEKMDVKGKRTMAKEPTEKGRVEKTKDCDAENGTGLSSKESRKRHHHHDSKEISTSISKDSLVCHKSRRHSRGGGHDNEKPLDSKPDRKDDQLYHKRSIEREKLNQEKADYKSKEKLHDQTVYISHKDRSRSRNRSRELTVGVSTLSKNGSELIRSDSSEHEVSPPKQRRKKDGRNSKEPSVIQLSDDDAEDMSDEMIEKLHKRLTTSLKRGKERMAEGFSSATWSAVINIDDEDQSTSQNNVIELSPERDADRKTIASKPDENSPVPGKLVSVPFDLSAVPLPEAPPPPVATEGSNSKPPSTGRPPLLPVLGKKPALKFGLKISETSAQLISLGVKCEADVEQKSIAAEPNFDSSSWNKKVVGYTQLNEKNTNSSNIEKGEMEKNTVYSEEVKAEINVNKKSIENLDVDNVEKKPVSSEKQSMNTNQEVKDEASGDDDGENLEDDKKSQDRKNAAGDSGTRRQDPERNSRDHDTSDRKQSGRDRDKSRRHATSSSRQREFENSKSHRSHSRSPKKSQLRSGSNESRSRKSVSHSRQSPILRDTKSRQSRDVGSRRSNSRSRDNRSRRSQSRSRHTKSRRSRSHSRDARSHRSKSQTPVTRRSRSHDRDRRSRLTYRSRSSRSPRSKSPRRFKHSRSKSGSRSRRARSRHSQSPAANKTDCKLVEANRLNIDKDKLREIAIKNAYTNMQFGIVPIPDLKPAEVAVIKAGGKSVEELTEFCKKIAAEQQVKGIGGGGDTNTDTIQDLKPAVEDEDTNVFISTSMKAMTNANIILNIRNAKQLPIMTPQAKAAQTVVLRTQFPVSSGSEHRTKENEWVPVTKDDSNPATAAAAAAASAATAADDDKVFVEAPSNPQELETIVGERVSALRKLKNNPHDMEALGTIFKVQQQMKQWAEVRQPPGQFLGSTGVQTLTPQELANENPRCQAWVRKDTFTRAAPVAGGIGRLLLQKMGWKVGTGLGKNNEGITAPLALDIKTDRRGLTSFGESTRKPAPLMSGGAHHAPRTVHLDLSDKHPVSALNELCSKRRWNPPHFEPIEECGANHFKTFRFKVLLNGVEYLPAVGSTNKKTAKMEAAQLCLQELGLVPRTIVGST